ncbi:MAG: hypothetical protein CSA23_02910 [Deltaproteobacteria bacterium]|nr:MAG: hypothetical protein CSA23_02910 [Deltaproteobacteria bacterium]
MMDFFKQHRTILVVGAILLIAGMVYRFYPALNRIAPRSNDIESKLKQVAKYRKRVKSRENLQAAQVALTRRLEQARRTLLDAGTPALAAVHIQNLINEIIYANNMNVASIRVLKARDAQVEGFFAVPVVVSLKLSVRQMLDLLYRIESAGQLLSVTGLSVRRQTADPEELLTAILTVEGYMRKP